MPTRSLPVIAATLLALALSGCGHESLTQYTGVPSAASDATYQAVPTSLIKVMRHPSGLAASALPVYVPPVQPTATATPAQSTLGNAVS